MLMDITTLKPATVEAKVRPAWTLASAKPSIGACLGLAFLTVLIALSLGLRLARQSTWETVHLIRSVQSQYEPILARSHNLAAAITGFERDVMERTHTDPAVKPADLEYSALQILATFDEYTRLAAVTPGIASSDLQPRLLEFQNQGLAIAALYRQRDAEIQRTLTALNALVARASSAGRGIESGDQLFARKSLAELSRAATALRISVKALTTDPAPGAMRAVAGGAARFATLLHSHEAEFERSPGRAWLELMHDDFRAAATARTRFLQLEQGIATQRIDFERSARDLNAAVDSDLQKPAWQSLTETAGRARYAAEDTETLLTRVAAGILAAVFFMGMLILFGIGAPVRRLLEGTRRLARGTLEARVRRGGLRELDELAAAFNDMAEALDSSQQSVRGHQLVLEERISQRTKDLHHLAYHDSLTDLPNRRGLATHLATIIDRPRAGAAPWAVLYMDIDNFKTINDSLGHQFGDRVLRRIGARLLKIAGSSGFLARLGGDEFTLVVDNVPTAAAAERYVSQIMRAFTRPLRIGDRELMVSLSAGVALYPEHGGTAEALLQAADSALYDAKDRGRNGFQIYRTELLSAASHRFHTEQALRRALESDDFLLHFQPEVSLLEKKTMAIEALLRWRQPDGRIAAASEFIDIAEKSGLILELSDWLLRSAIEAARKLRAGPWPQARVAINVSAQQFLSGRFVAAVERTLREAQMPSDCLEIELTESALQTGRRAIEALHELRRLGVAVALDDFGSGYSTLKSIEELPLTRVKLDRSLSKDIETNESAAAFARSCIQLCQSLGLTVTVEGIERPGQLEALATCGDIHVQGYLIATPAPLEEIVQFVAETPARIAAIWPRAATWLRETPGQRDSAPVSIFRPRVR